MDNENTNTNTTTNDAAPSPLEQLEALRANTVDKAEYERVVAERNQMFQSLASQPRPNAAPEAPKVDPTKRMAELRASLYGEDCQLSNLDYWKNTLELRQLILDQGGRDPFLPYGKDNAIDDDDIKTVSRVVAGVQSCIDYADGDSDIFTNELQRITVDTPVARMASRANR